MPKIYRVGGCVRDKILNVKPKDIDYVFVDDSGTDVEQSQNTMITWLRENGQNIFCETKRCFTARCKKDILVDFVLARKDLGQEPNSRMPNCVPATLQEDLERRDFTMNAIAEDDEGNLQDYFNGAADIQNKILRTPIDPYKSFGDDPLRLIRAMRFHITKGFQFCSALQKAFDDDALWEKMKTTVSVERIREELQKCFHTDTIQTLEFLKTLSPSKIKILFGDTIWLKPSVGRV